MQEEKKKDSIEKNYCRKKRKKEIEGYKIWTQIEKGDFDTIKTEEKFENNIKILF